MSDRFRFSMASRKRKQRFPHADRRRTSSFLLSGPIKPEYDPIDYTEFSKRSNNLCRLPSSIKRARKSEPSESPSNSPQFDRRLRDEHNEQERSRRRELAVIYELIRCSFSQSDLRHLGPGNTPKSIEKLSYPQVLQIAYHIIREENHNLQLFERTLVEIKKIEKEFLRAGLPLPARPPYPSITETYRKVVNIVDGLLKRDKAERSVNDGYRTTPSQLAALGDYQLDFLRSKNVHDDLEYSPPHNCHFSTSVARLENGLASSNFHFKFSPKSPKKSPSLNFQRTPPKISSSSKMSSCLSLKSEETMPTSRGTSSSSKSVCTLPRIGTVLKPDFDSTTIETHDDDVLSSRTMHHSSADPMEYVDELELPVMADPLSIEEELSFFENSVQQSTFGGLDCAHIFPEMSL